MRGDDLAVQVGQADLVVVNNIQRAYAASCQCLDYIAADAADTEHRHAGVMQPLHSLGTE